MAGPEVSFIQRLLYATQCTRTHRNPPLEDDSIIRAGCLGTRGGVLMSMPRAGCLVQCGNEVVFL